MQPVDQPDEVADPDTDQSNNRRKMWAYIAVVVAVTAIIGVCYFAGAPSTDENIADEISEPTTAEAVTATTDSIDADTVVTATTTAATTVPAAAPQPTAAPAPAKPAVTPKAESAPEPPLPVDDKPLEPAPTPPPAPTTPTPAE